LLKRKPKNRLKRLKNLFCSYLANHNKPPQGAAPTQAKRAATAGGAGSAAKAAGSTKSTGTPKPKAKATLPQVPEPKPAKLLLGRKLAGAAPKGNATNKPLPAATQCTNADERKANEARATRPPTKNDETRNTEAHGKDERTRLSTPQAQPTATAPEKPTTEGKKARHEDTAKEPATREPEKATQGKEPTKEAKDTITHLKKINAKKMCMKSPP
jgi:hypothetical protein